MNWISFFFFGWGITFTIYIVVQAIAFFSLRGRAKWVVLAPVIPMAWVAYATADAWAQQSNLWPILMIFASPLALTYVIAVALFARLIRNKPTAPANGAMNDQDSAL